MLLGEPERTQFDLNFRLFGIPVRIHPYFWIVGLLLGRNAGNARALLTWMAAFFLGILCHELGHALVMQSQGARPWITLHGFGGLASCDRMRGLRSANAESWRQLAVSAAGPLAGFIIAAVVVGLVLASDHAVKVEIGVPFGLSVGIDQVIWTPYLSFFIDKLLFVTVVYGILNLVPVYPLDGGQIAREVAMMLFGAAEGIRQSLLFSIFVAGMLALSGAFLWHDFFLAILFGLLAFSNFTTLQAYSGRRPW